MWERSAVLHQKDIVQRGNNGEGEGGAQEDGARDPYPALGSKARKSMTKKTAAICEKVFALPKMLGLKISQSRDRKQDCAGGEDRNIAAENQHGKFPRNFVQDGKYKKHRAQQEFVRNGIEILTEQSLLMQLAGQQAVQSIAEAGDDEEKQRPEIAAIY